MNITITTRRKHPVLDEDLYSLFMSSYLQWKESGVEAPWLYFSLDEFKEMLQQSVVFLALNTDSYELLGMHCMGFKSKKRVAYGFNLAITPEAKHQGIATLMLKYEIEQLQKRGYRYLRGTTSVPATWSVRWHLKNGYRIKGYSMGRAPYSGSYQFRLQLAPFSWRHPSTWLWNKPLAPITARLCYLASYTFAHLVHQRNGELNWIGRLGKKLKDVRCMMEDGRRKREDG